MDAVRAAKGAYAAGSDGLGQQTYERIDRRSECGGAYGAPKGFAGGARGERKCAQIGKSSSSQASIDWSRPAALDGPITLILPIPLLPAIPSSFESTAIAPELADGCRERTRATTQCRDAVPPKHARHSPQHGGAAPSPSMPCLRGPLDPPPSIPCC